MRGQDITNMRFITMNKYKQQKNKVQFLKELPIYIWLMSSVCILLAIVAIVVTVVMAQREPEVEFIPPAFEAEAVVGVPEVPEEYAYKEIYQAPMPFSASLCGAVFNEDGRAVVYFTNPESNEVWLKLRICDESGNILGESGLLKPGEYIRSVPLSVEVAAGTALRMRIMGYEPDTYMSAGSVSINTVMQ